jgi:hypothetical protein
MVSFIYQRVRILLFYFLDFPKKFVRFAVHFIPFIAPTYKIKVKSFKDWIFDLPFYLFDLIMFPELIEFFILTFTPSIKKLNIEQRLLLRQVFDGCIREDRVWVNRNASLFTNKLAIAYVVGNIVNYRQDIHNTTFIHELVHVCQYQKYGSVYISRALRAQINKDPYDYGGSFGLAKAIAKGRNFINFNFEQQAQIIEDYYEITNKYDLKNTPQIRNTYAYYVMQFQKLYSIKD